MIDLSTVMPFSSSAIVSRYSSKQAFYYDPVEVLIPQNQYPEFIDFRSDHDELKLSIYNYIKRYKSLPL